MRFDIITVFPRIFDSYFSESILKRAQARKLLTVRAHDLRTFAGGKHRKVDDRPFGGGPGMVIQIEPVYRAVQSIKLKMKKKKIKSRTILFSTRGKKFDEKAAKRLSKYDALILICGRYEGVDERVAVHVADEEISMGDYVLSGGEIPAMAVIEAVSRFIPGVLGKYESLEGIKGSYSVYSRPEVFYPKRGGRTSKPWTVPKALLSGNHALIQKWRRRT